jgi:hypothetical protein
VRTVRLFLERRNPLLAQRGLGHIRALFEVQLGCAVGGDGYEGEREVREGRFEVTFAGDGERDLFFDDDVRTARYI